MWEDPAAISSEEEYVVGVEKNIQELVMQLTEERDDRCKVFCIWGMVGVGKTTLARQIYHHSEIRSHFAGIDWVPVSGHVWYHTLKHRILRDTAIEYNLYDRKGEGAVVRRGRGKEYLVIRDDVRSDKDMRDVWRLCFKFPNIKVLLTTRNKGVARGRAVFFHELRCLDEQHSWELFEKKADFRRHVKESEYNEMKELGQKKLQLCGGLPLAITTLGELLSRADTTFEWQDILFGKSVKANQREDKTNKLGELKDISRELSSSYSDLPFHLRRCFLYLAHFPRDSEISVKDLCRIWSAESSLISEPWPNLEDKPWPYLEDKAYEAIDELVRRCMVQVEKLDLDGRIKTLRVHSLMRQLCLVKAEEERFVKIINPRKTHEEVGFLFFDELADVVQNCNHTRIAIHLNKDVDHELLPFIESIGAPRCIESLICFSRLPHPSYESVMKPLLKQFPMLRILKFENLSQGYIGNLPEEIGELSSLRFLSLKGSHVEQVPASIGNLVYLETLDLRTKWTLKLPNVLWKLEKLRHLYLGHRSYIGGNELRLGDLGRLQTLVNIPLMCFHLDDSLDLNQVRKFKFYVHAKWWQKNNPRLILCFDLRSLAVENLSRARVDLMPLISGRCRIEKLRLEGKIEKLPVEYLINLIKLTLNRTVLEDDPMRTLEELPNLRFLLLSYNAFTGNAMVCSDGGFRRLESLSLVALEQLKEWRVGKWALPNLSFLLIEYCYKLEAIPDNLNCVANLKKLVIKRMPMEFKMKIEDDGNDFCDFCKVQHVRPEFLDD